MITEHSIAWYVHDMIWFQDAVHRFMDTIPGDRVISTRIIQERGPKCYGERGPMIIFTVLHEEEDMELPTISSVSNKWNIPLFKLQSQS